MIVCRTCRVEMECTKTGLGVRFGDSHVYPGDAFQCPMCGAEIIKTGSTPVFDPEKLINTIQVNDGVKKAIELCNTRKQ